MRQSIQMALLLMGLVSVLFAYGNAHAQYNHGYYWNGSRWEYRGAGQMPVIPPGPVRPYPPYQRPSFKCPDCLEEYHRWGGEDIRPQFDYEGQCIRNCR